MAPVVLVPFIAMVTAKRKCFLNKDAKIPTMTLFALITNKWAIGRSTL